MSIIDRLTSLFAPYDCLVCGGEGTLLCRECAARELPPAPARCFYCQLPETGSRCCESCRLATGLTRVQAAAAHGGAAQQLVWQLKFQGAQSAARLMAQHMASLLTESTDCLLVPVPTATSRIRQRGYDQAALIARELSRQTRLPWATLLVRHGQHHQVGASRQQRLNQLAAAYQVTKPRAAAARRVILIDDVATTGATLSAAARVLRAAGAAHIEGVVFTQA